MSSAVVKPGKDVATEVDGGVGRDHQRTVTNLLHHCSGLLLSETPHIGPRLFTRANGLVDVRHHHRELEAELCEEFSAAR